MSEGFSVNAPWLFVLVGIVIVYILAQSVYFLVRAWRRAVSLGFDKGALKRMAVSSAVFTLAPALAILLGVITLSKFLGLPLPWLRLSVIGALTYELPAATTAAGAMGLSLSEPVSDARQYATIAWVMTLGIIPGLVLIPLFLKKIQGGVMKLKGSDGKWGDIFMNALFLGMIASFLGTVFADVRSGLAGWIPVFVMLCSAAAMGVMGLLIKSGKAPWLENYALPFSMLFAMGCAIPITLLIV